MGEFRRLANNEDKEKFEKSNKPTRKENGQGMERVEKVRSCKIEHCTLSNKPITSKQMHKVHIA